MTSDEFDQLLEAVNDRDLKDVPPSVHDELGPSVAAALSGSPITFDANSLRQFIITINPSVKIESNTESTPVTFPMNRRKTRDLAAITELKDEVAELREQIATLVGLLSPDS